MIIVQCIHDISTSYGLGISLFLAGLVGGVTHCVGMCSPFVLAQVGGREHSVGDSSLSLERLRSALLLPYHFGRATTYVVLAVLVSSVINLAFVYSDLKMLIAAPMLVLAGVIFFVSAFPRLSVVFPWGANIRMNVPYKAIEYFSSRLMEKSSVFGRYALGVLLGFMPCGLVISALLASATAPTALQAGLAMMAFAIGTMPALFLIAFGGQSIKRRYPRVAERFSQGVMTISGLWLFLLAGTMIFN